MNNNVLKSLSKQMENSTSGLYLHASECITPPSVQLAHSTDLSYRYSHTKRENLTLGDAVFANALYFNQLRDTLKVDFSKLLNCETILLNALSGMNAVNSVIQALVKKDDNVFIVKPLHGGHPSVKGIIKSCEAHVHWIPFYDNMNINWELLEENIIKIKPKLVLLNISDSLSTNHLPNKKFHFSGTVFCVDISHYLSMYMTSKIGDLFKIGVDILLGSTHKSFPGPHKGFVAINDSDLATYINEQLSFYVSSDHSHHLLSLWVALEEFKYYGEAFVKQSIKNLNALGKALKIENFNVVSFEQGFGNTHQLWIAFDNEKKAREYFLLLERIGLYVNFKNLAFNKGWGFRIGIQEATLLGFKEQDMKEISSIIAKRLRNIESENISISRIYKLLNKNEPIWNQNSELLEWLKTIKGKHYET